MPAFGQVRSGSCGSADRFHVVFLLVGGMKGDRWPRRRIMIGADGLRCAAQTALAGLWIAGLPSLAALVLLTALIG